MRGKQLEVHDMRNKRWANTTNTHLPPLASIEGINRAARVLDETFDLAAVDAFAEHGWQEGKASNPAQAVAKILFNSVFRALQTLI